MAPLINNNVILCYDYERVALEKKVVALDYELLLFFSPLKMKGKISKQKESRGEFGVVVGEPSSPI
jgi:hypothetical protein